MIELLESRSPLTTEDLRVLCIREGWFTNGDNEQYQKLFDLNRAGASPEDLALVIWICSTDVSREEVLHVLAREYRRVSYD